jgi:predicted small metal-binding protein
MKTLKCADVAGIACDFVATGETDAEVKAKLAEHGASAHADMMNGMTEEQKAAMATKIDGMLAAQ